ncbi:MAG: 3-dehydroquinate synthase [Fimbriimonadales bacterium]|nr:3-dehydroquinate synthase [Fimbriimonadales bacterium]
MQFVFLTGNMGAGKSVVGRLLAQQLRCPFYDLDALIETAAGMSIAELFTQQGEPRFRQLEREQLRSLVELSPGVVATGGGTIIDAQNRALMRQHGWVIYLRARPETLVARIKDPTSRPLLQTADTPLQALQRIAQQREPLYQEADWVMETETLTPQQVVEQLRRLVAPTPELPLCLHAPRSEIRLAPGVRCQIAEHLLSRIQPSRTLVLTHPVLQTEGEKLAQLLQAHGVLSQTLLVPAGERFKTLRTATRLYRTLLEAQMDRRSVLIVLGGGMLGDLGGFVAATYMRGIPFVQVPSTLLAQVDASIGGKVAVDLPQGKNLVGAFHQPMMVLTDPELLPSLPTRQWRNGLAEMLKYGIALNRGLWRRLQTLLAQRVISRQRVRKDPAEWFIPIARCAAIKAEIVAQDERDEYGKRALLNFGHTVGHAIEVVLDYRQWLHGEAVAAGMRAEAELGVLLGITPAEVRDELEQTLQAVGLPTRLPSLPAEPLLYAMRHDKKRVGTRLQVVLLRGIGEAQLIDEVPIETMREALKRCGAQ